MPRAFLVKKNLRRSTIVDDNSLADMSARDLGDFDSGKRPSQLENSESTCSAAERDFEKNRRTIELKHRTQSGVGHAEQSQGS